jgi:hypothetical protein
MLETAMKKLEAIIAEDFPQQMDMAAAVAMLGCSEEPEIAAAILAGAKGEKIEVTCLEELIALNVAAAAVQRILGRAMRLAAAQDSLRRAQAAGPRVPCVPESKKRRCRAKIIS